jgi:hypothetical protein
MEKERRPRGRPRNAVSPDRARREDVRKDETIARSVDHLIWLGFPEDGVYATVARCAFEVLRRHNHADELGPLRARQIEHIYKTWRDQGIGRHGRKLFTKESLQARAPAGRSLAELATEMLRNDGDLQPQMPVLESFTYVDPWTGEEKTQSRHIEGMPVPAMVLTPKMAAELIVRVASGRLAPLGDDKVRVIRPKLIKIKRGN